MVRYKADKPKGVALAQHVADTPLAKRMLEQMGKDDYQLMKTISAALWCKVSPLL